jgi:putative membrane protein
MPNSHADGMPLAKFTSVPRQIASRLRRSPLILAAVLALAITAGCDREYRALPVDSIRSGWAGHEHVSQVALDVGQRDFLNEVAQASLFEIEASRIALSRAASSAVRRYAESTLRDRLSGDTDLEQLAASVGVVLPSQLNDNLRARLSILAQLAGSDFDRAYARNVGVLAQEEALAAFERAADGHGLRVQRYAADRVPVLRKQLELGRRLASQVDKTDMA